MALEKNGFEKMLSQKRDYLKNLLNSLGDAIFTVKLPGRKIEYVNRSIKKIFGYTPDECIGNTTAMFYPNIKDYQNFALKLKSIILIKEERFHTEQVLKRKNGELFSAAITTTFTEEHGQITGIISVVRDITDQKIAEKRLKLQKQELSDFVHFINHDVQNSIMKIKEYTNMLFKEGETTFALKIQRAANHIHNLLDRSVTLAEAGMIIKKTEIIDLQKLITPIAQDIVPRNINFSCSNLPMIECDYLKTIQIFQNLIENAITHGNPNNIEITHEENTILVSNDGQSIPEQDRPNIFEKGFSTKAQNSGLGLAIVKKNVEAHGWTITLNASLKTNFCINLLG